MPTVRPEIFETTVSVAPVSPPSTAQAGDLLLAFLSAEATIFDFTLTGGTPEWEPLTSKTTVSSNGSSTLGVISSGVWWKPAGNGETNWTLDGGGTLPDYMAMAVVAITDALLEAPLFTVSGDQASTTTTLTAVNSPAGPIPAIGDLELRWVGGDNYSTSVMRQWTEPSLTSEVADLSASYVAMQLTRQNITGASSVARAHNVSGGVYAAHGFTLRIRQAAVSRRSFLSPAAAVHRSASW